MADINDLPVIAEPQQSLPTNQSLPVVPASQVFGGADSVGITIDPPNGGFFTVRGKTTSTYRANLKKLGGIFNWDHKVWSFELSNLQDVKNLVDGITKGTVTADPIVSKPKYNKHQNGIPHQSNDVLNLPTISIDNHFKSVGPWKIFVPVPGMLAKVQVDKNIGVYTVVSVNGNQTEGYRAFISNGNGTGTPIRSCNGYWEVVGYVVNGEVPKHSIRFEVNRKG